MSEKIPGSSLAAKPEMAQPQEKQPALHELIAQQVGGIQILPEDKNEKGEPLVSPNGPVSHLPEQEWCMVRTPAFKAWFEGSKVVDENGEPLMLFHGSPERFERFNPDQGGRKRDSGFFGSGSYFTPRLPLAEKYGPVIYRVFLNIKDLAVFTLEHGNVRFCEKSLPPEIHDEVYEKYEPQRQEEFERLTQRGEANKGKWGYMSNWNGENDFEYILSKVVREVLVSKGMHGAMGLNPVSKRNEYVAFDADTVFILPEK